MFKAAKPFIAAVLSLVLMLTLTPIAAAQQTVSAWPVAEAALSQVYGKITKSVTFREGPSTAYPKLGSITKGNVVTVLNNAGSWWNIMYNGATGYVHKNYITMTTEAPVNTGIVPQNTVNAPVPEGQLGSALNINPADTPALPQTPGLPYTPGLPNTFNTPAAPLATDALAGKVAQAQAVNRDCIGWIEVPGTNISDPILYRSNFYYAYYDINHKKSYNGVYTQYGSLQRNNPLYGHNNRKSNSGFHQMHHLQEGALGKSTCMSNSCSKKVSGYSDWYKTPEGRTWNISLFGRSKWEVFAMYEVDQYEPRTTLTFNYTPTISDYWLNYQLARSQINFGVPVTTADTIITVITCGDNYDSASAQSRLYVFLKCVA